MRRRGCLRRAVSGVILMQDFLVASKSADMSARQGVWYIQAAHSKW